MLEKSTCGCSRVKNLQAPKGYGGVLGFKAARRSKSTADIMDTNLFKYYTTQRGYLCGNTAGCNALVPTPGKIIGVEGGETDHLRL